MTPTAVQARRMRWWDIPDVMRLEVELFGDEAWAETMYWSELAQTDTRWYLVVDVEPGQITAYAGLCVYAPHESYVQTIGVTKALQGNGIGTALLTALIDESLRRGCRHLDLEVRADNPTAIRLYERQGFAQIGVRRNYYQPSGTDAVVMRREAGA